MKRVSIALACLWLLQQDATAQETNAAMASTAVYVFTDTDRTTVVTPRAHVGVPLAPATRVDLVYTADVWTSASIDIRTSASRRLDDANQLQQPKPVTEQRDEIDVSLQHAFPDVTLDGSYRYSTEFDYESHGGAISGAYDFADKSTQVGLGVRAYFDQVGRAGDPGFNRDATMLTARASLMQLIDPLSFAVLTYELTRQQGYLSSPYRSVRIAGDAGMLASTCGYEPAVAGADPIAMCVPERNPDLRLRHALAVQARRALGDAISVGASYRFYLDDWDMTSHTAGADVAVMPDASWLLSLGYRFYHQSSASHYATFYPPMPPPEHFTSDKELSALSSHRLELEVSRSFDLDDLGSELRAVLRLAPALFLYHEFPLLDQIQVLETTLAVEVAL